MLELKLWRNSYQYERGPANESGQILNFITSNDNNALFSVQPYLDNDGTIHYTAAADAYGLANVSIQLHDDGGTVMAGSTQALFKYWRSMLVRSTICKFCSIQQQCQLS